MAISDLEARQGNVEVVGEITEISEPREFSKFGRQGRVANALLKDQTGTIRLSLWNEQIDSVKVGDKVHIKNAYVNEWQGEKQLTTGKFGTIEVIQGEEAAPGEAKAETRESTKKTKKLEEDDSDSEDEDSDSGIDEEEIY